MPDITYETVATGFVLPEGPVACQDGSVLLVEVGAGRLSRIGADGRVDMIAHLAGGPNGAAIGPDGAIYVCNNGGGYSCVLAEERLRIGFASETYVGGSIQRVDLATGTVTTLYRHCDGEPLLAPNDLVFDRQGSFWFSDHGRAEAQGKTYGALYHASADGTAIRCARPGLLSPNGIGLSPDERWLYWADTLTARLWRAEIVGPGRLASYGAAPGELVCTPPGYQMLDSLAVEAEGRVCIGTIVRGGITVVSPDGLSEHVPIADAMVTNICFGGADGRDVWITAAETGRLLRGRWPRPGLPLAFAN